jgi:hypothetical protein
MPIYLGVRLLDLLDLSQVVNAPEYLVYHCHCFSREWIMIDELGRLSELWTIIIIM